MRPQVALGNTPPSIQNRSSGGLTSRVLMKKPRVVSPKHASGITQYLNPKFSLRSSESRVEPLSESRNNSKSPSLSANRRGLSHKQIVPLSHAKKSNLILNLTLLSGALDAQKISSHSTSHHNLTLKHLGLKTSNQHSLRLTTEERTNVNSKY
jgi:hypothetical protein